jgi:hypothetical protein
VIAPAPVAPDAPAVRAALAAMCVVLFFSSSLIHDFITNVVRFKHK